MNAYFLLSDLPPELFITILTYLPLPSLAKVFTTCADFSAFATSESLWESLFRIHFSRSRLQTIPPQTISSLTYLERVKTFVTQLRSAKYSGCVQGEIFVGKFVLIGDLSVGKTKLQERYIRNEFYEYHHGGSPIGPVFLTKSFEIGELADDIDFGVTMDLWDTQGQERYSHYKPITPLYYRNSVGFFFVFDLMDRQSFLNIPTWFDRVFKAVSDQNLIIRYVLIGNKLDLVPDTDHHHSRRLIQKDEIDEMIDGFRPHVGRYFETSAKNGQGVAEAFQSLVRDTARIWSRYDPLIGSRRIGEEEVHLLNASQAQHHRHRRCF